MLTLPKARFLAVGLLEALAAASGMAAGGMLAFFFYCEVCKYMRLAICI